MAASCTARAVVAAGARAAGRSVRVAGEARRPGRAFVADALRASFRGRRRGREGRAKSALARAGGAPGPAALLGKQCPDACVAVPQWPRGPQPRNRCATQPRSGCDLRGGLPAARAPPRARATAISAWRTWASRGAPPSGSAQLERDAARCRRVLQNVHGGETGPARTVRVRLSAAAHRGLRPRRAAAPQRGLPPRTAQALPRLSRLRVARVRLRLPPPGGGGLR